MITSIPMLWPLPSFATADEARWFTLGRTPQGTLLAVAHTWHATGPNTARARLISARPATRRERDQYEHLPR